MNNQPAPLPVQKMDRQQVELMETQKDPQPPLPPSAAKRLSRTRFWYERAFVGGLILSLTLYYVLCNPNLPYSLLGRQNPLYSLPFFVFFAVLCWYRLPYALALLPLTLPYYLKSYQKTVFGSYSFSLVEITLWTCVAVALLRFLLVAEDRALWKAWRTRIRPFLIPIGIFLLAALVSTFLAIERATALRVLRQEVIGPLCYLSLLLVYLRTRADIQRLVAALVGTGALIALFGLIQYYLFNLPVDAEGSRVHAVYGSGNSIGTLFDYILPLLLALVMSRVKWRWRLLALLLCIPMGYVLYLSKSRGAWIAIAGAIVFSAAFSVRNRKVVLAGGIALVTTLVIVLTLFHANLFAVLEQGHVSSGGQSTIMKRPYLWLTALNMLEKQPWTGYGLDNWLCYYSSNRICRAPVMHYWVLKDPVTHQDTGLQDEPTLSHPHNIFLHVWVSIGIFGLLAFVAVLALFYWLYARLLIYLRAPKNRDEEVWRWLTIGVGAALCAALIQGQVDSAFLEQDLAFCFWTLIAALLLIRTGTGIAPRRETLMKYARVH